MVIAALNVRCHYMAAADISMRWSQPTLIEATFLCLWGALLDREDSVPPSDTT